MTVKNYVLDLWCQLAADRFNFGQFTVTTLALTRYVHMGAATTRALSLILLSEPGNANHHQSLLGHIEHCCTSQRHR